MQLPTLGSTVSEQVTPWPWPDGPAQGLGGWLSWLWAHHGHPCPIRVRLDWQHPSKVDGVALNTLWQPAVFLGIPLDI